MCPLHFFFYDYFFLFSLSLSSFSIDFCFLPCGDFRLVPVLFTFFHLEQQGYQRLGSFYYRVSSVGMGFEAANNECEGAGARMLSMKNSQEHQFLRALNVTEQIVWIRKKEAPAELLRFFLRNVFLSALNVPEGGGECSGKDSACDGVLQWRDGDAFAFDNTFGITNLAANGGPPFCMEIKLEQSAFDDYSCSDEHKFVCVFEA